MPRLAASELIGASAAQDRHERRPGKPPVASLTPAIAAAGLLLSGLAQGATIAVDTTGAVADTDNGNCSLIEAIQSANTDTAEDACTSGDGADTITLPEDSTHTLQAINNTTLRGPSGLPVITTTITIQGAGATIQRDPNAAAFRILAVSSGGDLTVNGITIRGGDSGSDDGGGVFVASGEATFNKAVVKDNIAGDRGGGIAIFDPDAVTITATEIANNSAQRGGGIYSDTDLTGSTLTIANSTISGNSASTRGGGLYNFIGLTVVENSTFTGNNAPSDEGAGIASYGLDDTETRLAGTVVAGNNGTDVDFVVDSNNNSFTSNGDNLIGSGNATGAFTAAGDSTGIADPGLGALAANGGPTRTHAVLAGSPALDAIPNDRCPPPAADQRGIQRPADGDLSGDARCDIGAFELADTDGDGTLNSADAFPGDPSETTDTDGDGVGNNADPDDDGDGLADADDPEPLVPREPAPEPARAVPTLTTWGWLVLSLALLLLGARPQYRRRS